MMSATFEKGFTRMSNKVLNDRTLSENACALMTKILSLPDYWRYTIKGLSSLCADGIACVRTALNELEQRKYLSRKQMTDSKGKFSHNEYVVAENIYDEGFTCIDNRIVRDKSLPLRALAVFVKMNCLPKDWKFTITGLTQIFSCGKTAIQSALRALENARYLVRQKLRDAKGRICGTEYRLAFSACHQKQKTLKQNKVQNTDSSKNIFSQLKERIAQLKPILQPNQENSPTPNVSKVFSKEKILEQVEYTFLVQKYPGRKREIDELIDLSAEILVAKRKTTRISGSDLPHALVQERFSKLTGSHFAFVLDNLNQNTNTIPVRNIKQYLLACLFNSVTTLENSISVAYQQSCIKNGEYSLLQQLKGKEAFYEF